jgi:hypothetical protein
LVARRSFERRAAEVAAEQQREAEWAQRMEDRRKRKALEARVEELENRVRELERLTRELKLHRRILVDQIMSKSGEDLHELSSELQLRGCALLRRRSALAGVAEL